MIFVDCHAALRIIASICDKSRLVRECKKPLRTFGLDRIRICWVPDESGILGNETANVLAWLGLLSGGDLVVGPNAHICHHYDLINGWGIS